MRRRLPIVAGLVFGAALAWAAEPVSQPAPHPELQPAPPPEQDAPAPQISARSTIIMRLDPRAPRDPRGTVGIGLFRVLARDGYDAEASGWVGHAPHAPGRSDSVVAGDVTTLRVRAPLGPTWVDVGRHWSTVGGQRFTGLDGLTAGLRVSEDLELAVRGGWGLPLAGDVFGAAFEAGGEAHLRIDGGYLRLGVLNSHVDQTPARTRWTLAAGRAFGYSLDARGAVTADVIARAVVDARIEVDAVPFAALRLRGYGRYARIEELLPPGDLLAAFAPDPRGELGLLGEWLPAARWRLRLDGAWAGMRRADIGARWRAAVEWLPRPGAWALIEGTARIEHHGHSGLLRVAGRWPISGTLFGTVEALGDVEAPGGAAVDPGGVGRLGLGFEPWRGWTVYGAFEGARTPRWSRRFGGVVLVEHALGAPVRWGGGP